MKKYILCIACTTLFLGSCTNFLELSPAHQINENNFYKTENDFERALIGVYASFRDIYTREVFFVAELTSDNAEVSISSSSVAEMEFDEMNLTPSNTIIQAFWTKALFTVARTNILLNRLEQSNINAETKARITGEAKFFRAYSYFLMVQTFGRSPLIDSEFRSPEDVANADLTLKSAEEVYAEIIRELKDAEGLLANITHQDKGRVALGTVKGLLGKVYLTRKQYTDAVQTLHSVIELNQYALVPDYGKLFKAGNANTSESLFELKFISGMNQGNEYSVLFTPASTGLLANAQQGSGRITPSLDLMKAYEQDDLRKTASVGDTIFPAGVKEYSRHGLKFVDLNASNPRDGSINFTVLRYADILLMYAEALNEAGKPADALQYLNEVRNRAGLGGVTTLEAGLLRQYIATERRVELAYEAHRWFDLLRIGKTQETMNAFFRGKGLNFTVEDHELVLPIPRREIDINPTLDQNTGY